MKQRIRKREIESDRERVRASKREKFKEENKKIQAD